MFWHKRQKRIKAIGRKSLPVLEVVATFKADDPIEDKKVVYEIGVINGASDCFIRCGKSPFFPIPWKELVKYIDLPLFKAE